MDFSKLLQNDATAEWVRRVIAKLSPVPYLTDVIIVLLALAIGSAVSVVVYCVLKRLMIRFYRRHCELSAEHLMCIRHMCASLVCCLPIYTVAYCVWVDGVHEWVACLTRQLMEGALVIAIAFAFTYAIRSFGLWYKQQRNAEQRPIDGLLRVAICFVWAGAVILFVAAILNKNPIYFISGLGATAAVLLLFFQQAILSVVASIQVNADHLVEIGDWISMDSDDVDGKVEEITLHTVKVRNWDRTVVCVPVCDLVNKPFVNYAAMQKIGGRRIKRAILIDQRSVRFLSEEEVKFLKGFDLLKEYLDGKESEIARYNAGRTPLNTRYLTNLGTFRAYAERFLAQNPNIRADMPLMVRVLAASGSGVPVEIYCFSSEVQWMPFERVQSDIMEHLLAILANFRLRVFQDCSDIYQEIGTQVDVVGGAFRFERLKNPVYTE